MNHIDNDPESALVMNPPIGGAPTEWHPDSNHRNKNGKLNRFLFAPNFPDSIRKMLDLFF